MSSRDRPQNNGKRPSVGSLIIVFILKIVGGLFDLFHVKGSGSIGNMTEEEWKPFSGMVDGMKQDMTKKD